ncbi:primary cilium assembly protein FAM149B1 [Rhinophrynus dorsalis]
MISRYKRKPVSQHLQISQSLAKAIENYPLPEKADTFPASHDIDECETGSDCRSESGISETTDFPRKDTRISNKSWLESQSSAELSTDNSSIISWGFDEFDQAATRQVQKIFNQIDELLFEEKANTLVNGLLEECQQWTSCFPHLRVKGKQIVAPLDDGYSWHFSNTCETSRSTSVSAVHAKDTKEEVQDWVNSPKIDAAIAQLAKRTTIPMEEGSSLRDSMERKIEGTLKKQFSILGQNLKAATGMACISRTIRIWLNELEENVESAVSRSKLMREIAVSKEAHLIDFAVTMARICLWYLVFTSGEGEKGDPASGEGENGDLASEEGEKKIPVSGRGEGDSSMWGVREKELGIFGTRFPLPNASVSFSLGIEAEEGVDEGVIVSDGTVEEYLAFDSRDKEDEVFEWKRAMSLDSLKMGYPPISPKYCRKEAVLACLFDDVWREALGCLEELIRKHWEESITDGDGQNIAFKTTRVESLNPYAPLHRHPLVLPPVPHYKIPAISPNTAHWSQGGSAMTSRNLTDLMVIHGIPLQQRALHPMEKVLDSDDKLPLRPTSSALMSGKPRPGRTLEHSSSSLSHNVQSARRRNPPRTLHPINNNPSRSGTPKMEDFIRGTRLQTTNDPLPCSPVPFNRNHLLPPIGTSDLDHHMPGSQRQTPDTSLGRSFVAYDHSNLHRNRRGSAGTDSISIGVTGISLGIASSSTSSIQQGYSPSGTEEKEDHHKGIPLHLSLKYHSHGGSFTRSRQGL